MGTTSSKTPLFENMAACEVLSEHTLRTYVKKRPLSLSCRLCELDDHTWEEHLANSTPETIGVGSPVDSAETSVDQTADFAEELRRHAPEVQDPAAQAVLEWRKRLSLGMEVRLDGDVVHCVYDAALQCLDIRDSHEPGALFPLANLGELTGSFAPHEGGGFALIARFHDSDATVFRFDDTGDRAAFALTLQSLAAEARAQKWHEEMGGELATTASICSSRSSDVDTERPSAEPPGTGERIGRPNVASV